MPESLGLAVGVIPQSAQALDGGDLRFLLGTGKDVDKDVAGLFGPAVAAALSGNAAPLGCLWVFIAGPLLGAALAAFLYRYLED